VLVFDRRFVLRTVNEGALTILNDDFDGLIGEAADQWPRQQVLGEFIRQHFAATEELEWQSQLELERPNGMPQVLLLRGSRLPEASGGGDVVVFDDVTRMIAAQRSAAWGEVARRLAHEIKNPLTPIQLSAERLQFKLAGKLANGDADMLARGTQTIINQVQAMKRMVDDFRDYSPSAGAGSGAARSQWTDREVLGLYESSSAKIEPGWPKNCRRCWAMQRSCARSSTICCAMPRTRWKGGRCPHPDHHAPAGRFARLLISRQRSRFSGRTAAAHLRTLRHHQGARHGPRPAHRQENRRGTHGHY
jgi:hypothetical protein